MEELFGHSLSRIIAIGLLLAALAVVVALSGRRIRKRRQFGARFRDAETGEFGKFDIEISAARRRAAAFTTEARFRMRHPRLVLYKRVQVFVEDSIVLEGRVTSPGQIELGPAHLRELPDVLRRGQRCRVAIDGSELFAADLAEA